MSDACTSSNLEAGIGELQITDEEHAEFVQHLYTKQPKRLEQSGKAAERLRQPARPRSGVSVSGALQPSQLVQQQQQQQQHVSSPVTPQGRGMHSPYQQWEGAVQQQQQLIQRTQPQAQGFDDTGEGFESLLELLNGPTDPGPPSGGACMPGSRADIIINAPMMVPAQPPPPPPPPPPPAPPAAESRSGPSKAPVSEQTRLALIKKLNPQSILVDENFNSQLHTAVLQSQPREAVDFLLCNLKRQKKLLPIINMVNICGHTPLSLCLKMRRADLLSLLIDFDAGPTQLCCCVSERTNHFHYAFAKCLDTTAAIQMVQCLISCVAEKHQSDLIGLHAKDRFRKTPLDYLNHRISQLSATQQEPDSAELLASMQWLKNSICRMLPRVEAGLDY
ncbi:hypothetical protein BOX15_Mlig002611g3 [Macrostomum lignano]|uniref:Uncharacterized protein n=2 Tax=Macrostomum lignano TaxID=282301 RepID=A0A267DC58_9PLAT|nr:hypothetical protein BOX15_Mlig002611g3 [Macrostomum lignano]